MSVTTTPVRAARVCVSVRVCVSDLFSHFLFGLYVLLYAIVVNFACVCVFACGERESERVKERERERRVRVCGPLLLSTVGMSGFTITDFSYNSKHRQ